MQAAAVYRLCVSQWASVCAVMFGGGEARHGMQCVSEWDRIEAASEWQDGVDDAVRADDGSLTLYDSRQGSGRMAATGDGC